MNRSFRELLQRVRLGDADAARTLVNQYESAIRIAIRARMSNPALRRHFDSMDVCQSVFGSFFFRMATGVYDVDQPEQLVALLMRIARNKLAMRVRYQFQQCRDSRRVDSLDSIQVSGPNREPDPTAAVVNADLVQRAFGLMDEESQKIAQMRADAATWAEVATIMGGTAESRRKQYARVVDRVAEVLRVDEPS